MKRRFLSVKELAEELGVHEDTIYRAHLKNMIPVRRVRKVLRFDIDLVLEAFAKHGDEKPARITTERATGGESRRRARGQSPRTVTRGH